MTQPTETKKTQRHYRHYQPVGTTLDDGQALYGAYLRTPPVVMEIARRLAERHRVSYATVLGDLLTRAVLAEAPEGSELYTEAEADIRVRPVKRSKGRPQT